MKYKIKNAQSCGDVNNVGINQPAVKVGFLNTYRPRYEDFLFNVNMTTKKSYPSASFPMYYMQLARHTAPKPPYVPLFRAFLYEVLTLLGLLPGIALLVWGLQ